MLPDTPQDHLLERFEHMARDAIFNVPKYVTAQLSTRLQADELLFKYHFDQRTQMKGPFGGTAYLAYELLYLFRNLDNQPSDEKLTPAATWAVFLELESRFAMVTDLERLELIGGWLGAQMRAIA